MPNFTKDDKVTRNWSTNKRVRPDQSENVKVVGRLESLSTIGSKRATPGVKDTGAKFVKGNDHKNTAAGNTQKAYTTPEQRNLNSLADRKRKLSEGVSRGPNLRQGMTDFTIFTSKPKPKYTRT